MSKVFHALGVVALVGLTAGVAAAAPAWSWTWRAMDINVRSCVQVAAQGLRATTGNEPEIHHFDANTAHLHAYWGDEVVFVECTAASGTVCDEPRAGLKILVTSSTDSETAERARDAVDTAIGVWRPYDCSTALDPR